MAFGPWLKAFSPKHSSLADSQSSKGTTAQATESKEKTPLNLQLASSNNIPNLHEIAVTFDSHRNRGKINLANTVNGAAFTFLIFFGPCSQPNALAFMWASKLCPS